MIGILIFLAGILVLAFVFREAYTLFKVPQLQAIGAGPDGSPIDLNKTGNTVLQLFYRIGLLFVMCVIGSVIANRGIRMYQHSWQVGSAAKQKKESNPKPPSEDTP